MDAKEILAKVKAFFLEPVIATPLAAPEAITTPTIYKLKDGSEIAITMAGAEPAAGDLVTVASMPAPAGDYELEDGTVISVDAGGAITVIVTPVPLTQPDFTAPTETKVPTLEERAKKLEEKISAIESQISGFSIPTDTVTTAQLAEAEAKITKQDEIIKGLFELAEKLIEQPTADPITLNGAKKEKFDRIAERDKKFGSLAENLKKTKQLNN